MPNKLLHRIQEQKGITGLETAIILIAFVVVAAVFAYTVLSAGLFSTQKAQEAVYSGLEEAQSTVELKGSVVASGRAELNDAEFVVWVGDTDATLARDTTNKLEGSAAISVVVAAGMAQNDTVLYRAMPTVDFTNGDTISFWIKAEAALDSNITFAIGTGADLQGTATETYVINTAGTGWEKHSFDLTGGDDDSAAYFGIYLSTDAAGTFYLDKVMVEDLASRGSSKLVLDNMDYLGWVADTDATVTRETTEKMEGMASLGVVVAAGASLNDTLLYHAMAAKDWSNGDTITFWVKVDSGTTDNLTFALATGTNLQATATQTYLINTSSTNWEKHTVTLSGADDDSAVYYGIYLSTDTTGTFYLDGIEAKASLNKNADPLTVYANQVVFSVSTVLGGEAIDFTTTTDADADGIISDEATRTHKVVISYSDSYQHVTDLAWTKTAIGKDDGDNLLEINEKFQITVDLTYVNNNAGLLDSDKVDGSSQFTLEVKPPKGAVLNIERTMPAVVKDISNLN